MDGDKAQPGMQYTPSTLISWTHAKGSAEFRSEAPQKIREKLIALHKSLSTEERKAVFVLECVSGTKRLKEGSSS